MNTRPIVAALLATSALAAPAMAQVSPSTTEPPVEAGAPAADTQQSAPVTEEGSDIVVTGIRASQAKSIDIKRNSAAIVDAISAEDIGKLPDVTIVDALQRVSGVQILRSAGEGSTVNIRSLPQVVTLLNGEQYLSPANLGSAQPNLNDIPAQIISGVVVFKSQDVRNAQSGVSGTIDLRTRRPFDFNTGFTVAGQGEYSTGEDTREDNYLTSGLISWRNDKIGFLATAAYSDVTLGNNYVGNGGGNFLQNEWSGGNGGRPEWIEPHGFEVFNRRVERERLGVSGAIEWNVSDSIKVTGEGFYTRFVEHDLRAGMNISNRWTGFGWTNPTSFEQTSIAGLGGGPVLDVDEYALDAWWVNSFSINRSIKSESKNFNLELAYDEGGPFTLTARAIYADADYRNTNGQVQGDLSNWRASTADGSVDHTFTLFRNGADRTRGTFYPANIAAQYPASRYSNGIVGQNGGRYIDPNPLGYARDPQLTLNVSGRNFVFGGFDGVVGGGLGANSTLRDYMGNLDSYTVGAYSSEGNNRNKSDLLAFRFDASYDFDKANGPLFGFVKRLDAGARGSRRETQISVYHLFSNLYGGNGAQTVGSGAPDADGCPVQYKAIDVVLDTNRVGFCRAGEFVPNAAFDTTRPASADNPVSVFQGYTANRPTRLAENNRTYFLDDFGSITRGFPGIWVADPRDFNDPLAFQNRVFGNAYPFIIPGASYDVTFREQNLYANSVLEFGQLTANVGVRAIRTEISVRQNVTDPVAQPYGDTNPDIGDTFSDRSYWDILPTVNVSVNLTDNLKARASFAKTMVPLDLGNYGGGLAISTSDSTGRTDLDPTAAPIGVRQVTGASAGGNPNLDPFRSTNYDVALEYYWGRASLLNAGIFLLDIGSFVNSQTIADGRFPDGDGVVRRTVNFTRPVQGRGGSLSGVEVGAKIALSDVLSTESFLRNFGMDANYTYADSQDGRGRLQRNGNRFAFPDNSRHQVNVALWYQDSALQTRVAYNRRSPRLAGDVQGIAVMQETTQYVDVNVTYALTDNISLYSNVSNLFGEIEKYYYEFDSAHKQAASRNEFEPRYSGGVRVRF